MKLPYRGILCTLALLAAVFLLPQSRPFAQSSNPGGYPASYYATPSYSYGSTPMPGGTPAPGYASSGTYLQSGPVGTMLYGNLNFKVPVSLTGHSFSFKYRNGSSLVTSAATVMGVITATAGAGGAPSALYLAVVAVQPTTTQFNLATTDWWLADTTASLEPTVAHQTLDLVNASWRTVSGAPNRYFAIPDTRAGHRLFSSFNGALASTSSGPVFWTSYGGSSVSLHYFVCFAPATGDPYADASLYLADLNTGQKAPPGRTDVRAAADWTFDPSYGFYPFVPVRVMLEGREAGHVFTLHSGLPTLPENPNPRHFAAVALTGTGQAVLDVEVGSGLQYWITRDAENGYPPPQPSAPATGRWAAGTNPTQTATVSAVGRFPAPPSRAAALVPHRFRVNGSTRAGHIFSVRMSDGYTMHFTDIPYVDAATNSSVPAYGVETIAQWGNVPLSNPLTVITFTAMIDPTRAILLRDESIVSGGGLAQDITVNATASGTDVFDGWVPTQLPPPHSTITLRVPASRVNDTFSLFAQATQPAIYPWPPAGVSYSWPTPLPPLETVTYSGFDGMADYAFEYYSLTLANPTPYWGGPFTLQDMATLQPHDVTAGENDLRAWHKDAAAVNLQISSSRTDHHLRVRHPNGEFFDITHPVPADNSSLGPNRIISNQSYYYFDATSLARAEMPWYVEDLDTGERIGPSLGGTYPDNDALIMWIAVAPPTNLTAVADATGINLAWVPGGTATGGGFIIERQSVITTSSSPSGWEEIARIDDSATTYLDDSFPVAHTIKYRIRATFGMGANEHRSAPSNVSVLGGFTDNDGDGLDDGWESANGWRPDDASDGLALGATLHPPASFSTPSNGTSAATLQWTSQSSMSAAQSAGSVSQGSPILYDIERAAEFYDDTWTLVRVPWNRIATVPDALGAYTDPTTSPEVRYYYRIVARAGKWRSEPSVEVMSMRCTVSFGAFCYQYWQGYTPSGTVALYPGLVGAFSYFPTPDPELDGPMGVHEMRSQVVLRLGSSQSFQWDLRNVTTVTAGEGEDGEPLIASDIYSAASPFAFAEAAADSLAFVWPFWAPFPPANRYTATKLPQAEGELLRWRVTATESNAGSYVIPKAWIEAYTHSSRSKPGEPVPVFNTWVSTLQPNTDADDAPAGGASDNSDEIMGPNDDDFLRLVLQLTPENISVGKADLLISSDVRVFDADGNMLALQDLPAHMDADGAIPKGFTVDFENPSGPLAGLASGRLTLYVESLAAKPVGVALVFSGQTPTSNTWGPGLSWHSHYFTPWELLVDANRDGEMSADAGSVNDLDATTAERPYRFWLNNDHDDTDADTPGSLDWQRNVPANRRDLEDFTRLWISLKGLVDMVKTGGVSLQLEWKPMDGTATWPADAGNPWIKVFAAAETDGGRKYVEEDADADAQINAPYGVRLGEAGRGGPMTLTLLPQMLTRLTESNPNIYLLFEGETAGKGRLVLNLIQGGQKIGEYPPLYLELRDIKNMYERWTVDPAASVPSSGASPQSAAVNCPWRLPAGQSGGFSYDSQSPEEKKYIVFAHGWNLDSVHKDLDAETAYKRLWWQGYKGRFAAYQWPTNYGFLGPVDVAIRPQGFDQGESIAWRCANQLAGLLTQLNGICPGQVYLFAHSHGNIVTGEALRVLHRAGAKINTYVACEAAVSADCYDAGMPSRFPIDFSGITGPESANVYPEWLEPAGINTLGAGTRVNFYNVNDWALNTGIWERNQAWKPDSGWFYFDDGAGMHDLTRFWHGLVNQDPGDQSNPHDRFEIMSYGSEARSRALGRVPESVQGFASIANMQSMWGTDPDDNKFRVRAWHSGQFNFTNMQVKGFWDRLLQAYKLKSPQ